MTLTLPELLARVAATYSDLEDALVPTRSPEPPDASPDPTDRPAPANLRVADHRHRLVRGLRWWVDAVHPKDGRVPRVGQDVRAMCLMLSRASRTMEPEDAAELASNLRDWLAGAWEHLGDPAPVHVTLPETAMDQTVRVADAARILGCTVRTIRRRVPAEHRPAGMVLLREAWRCDHCDLRHGECPHTRNVTVDLA